jgi:hypothetical protein
MSDAADFDLQAAWLRRFKADANSNLRAFALRLKEALPQQVTVHEKRALFGAGHINGVSVELGEHRYTLAIDAGHLKAEVAHVVRGIALSTRSIDPAEWFTRLTEETRQASAHARALSESLGTFMAS